ARADRPGGGPYSRGGEPAGHRTSSLGGRARGSRGPASAVFWSRGSRQGGGGGVLRLWRDSGTRSAGVGGGRLSRRAVRGLLERLDPRSRPPGGSGRLSELHNLPIDALSLDSGISCTWWMPNLPRSATGP